MSSKGYVAFDLGAESGRAVLATVANEKIDIKVVHRFPNQPQRLPSGWHWNLLDLWGNLIQGLKLSGHEAAEQKTSLVSLGVDTWGVDFGLVGKSGELLGLPFVYRDARNAIEEKRVYKKIPRETIYGVTGIQFLTFNSLIQLSAQHRSEPGQLANAKHLLFIPDLFHYFFCGKAVNEATIASTSQMIDARTGKWAKKMIEELGIPTQCLGKIVPAGTNLGPIYSHLADAAGIAPIDVILPGSHDTASAIAAAPVDVEEYAKPGGDTWAYLSSGTWSLMGAEIQKPLLTPAAQKASFTHERGVGGEFRLLKNIAGLWLVQECRRDFAKRGKEYDYATLTLEAGNADPFRTLIDPTHPPFQEIGNMLEKITAFAKATKQPIPQSPSEFVRCCLESLALFYRITLDSLETLLDRRIAALYIVGGGGRNGLLNQMTSDALNRPVVVGPSEATAIGNALMQAIGAKHLDGLEHLRAVVRRSHSPQTVHPVNPESFAAQMPRFKALLGK